MKDKRGDEEAVPRRTASEEGLRLQKIEGSKSHRGRESCARKCIGNGGYEEWRINAEMKRRCPGEPRVRRECSLQKIEGSKGHRGREPCAMEHIGKGNARNGG